MLVPLSANSLGMWICTGRQDDLGRVADGTRTAQVSRSIPLAGSGCVTSLVVAGQSRRFGTSEIPTIAAGLDLASPEFPREREQEVMLAGYDARLVSVARKLRIGIAKV